MSQDFDTHTADLPLKELFIAIKTHYRVIAGATIIAGALGVGGSLLMPNMYSADAKVLVQSQSALPAIFGQQLNLASGLTGVSLKNPAEMYMGLLSSRNIIDRVIEANNLQQAYKVTALDDARNTLTSLTKINSGKDSFIRIEVLDRDPAQAMRIANTYVTELQRATLELRLTESASSRKFLEDQLNKVKITLKEAEVKLQQVQEKTGISSMEAAQGSEITSVGAIAVRVAEKRAEVASASRFLTDKNPELMTKREELAKLTASLGSVQNAKSSGFAKNGLEYVSALRNVKYQEGLYESLAKQYEAARLEEAQEMSVIQIVDLAKVPDHKTSPKRSLVAVSGAFIGFILSLVWAVALGTKRNQTNLN